MAEEKDIGQIIREGTAIEEALEESFREAVRKHRAFGVPMVFWKDGELLKFPPISSRTFSVSEENFNTVTHRTKS